MYICKERKTSFPTKMVFYQRMNYCKEFSGSLAPQQWLLLPSSSTALTHTATQPGDVHWHHLLLALLPPGELITSTGGSSSFSPPAPPLFLCTLQTALPYCWVRHWQPSKSQTWRHCSEPALPQLQASSPATQKAHPRERWQLSWSMRRPWATWAPLHTGQPSPQASPEDTKMLWGPKLKSSHQTFKGKKLSSVNIRCS